MKMNVTTASALLFLWRETCFCGSVGKTYLGDWVHHQKLLLVIFGFEDQKTGLSHSIFELSLLFSISISLGAVSLRKRRTGPCPTTRLLLLKETAKRA
jgi:hypothetical protein